MRRYPLSAAFVRLGLFCVLSRPVPAFAAHIPQITPTVIGPVAGMFAYSYVIGNSSSAADNIFSFGLLNLSTAVLQDVSAPTGWFVEVGTSSVIWTSLSAGS